MKRLLHIKAAPREDESRTLKVSRSFLASFIQAHPGWVVDEIDLFREELPSLAMSRVDGRYMLLDGKGLFGPLKEAWQEIVGHIERFKAADAYIVSSPMWNFSIPYELKHYIDIIVQPNHLFRHGPEGVEGLVKGRRMAFITSRGGEYITVDARPYDHQEPYIRTIMGFIGITDITFIIAEPMDAGRETADERLRSAMDAAAQLGSIFP